MARTSPSSMSGATVSTSRASGSGACQRARVLLARPRLAPPARIHTALRRCVARGVLPHRLPAAGAAPESNTAAEALWYFEAIRAYHEATADTGAVKELFPVLESTLDFHRRGTRFGIGED